ncbi:hypothetical protein D3C80_1500220 [compost metagenome]
MINRRLDIEHAGIARRQRDDLQPVIDLIRLVTGIAEQPVQSGDENPSGGKRDVQLAVEGDIFSDIDEIIQRAAFGKQLAEFKLAVGGGRQVQIAFDVQRARTAVTRRERGIRAKCDITADRAVAAQRGASGNGGRAGGCRLIAVHQQCSAINLRHALISVCAAQPRGAAAGLVERAGSADHAAQIHRVGLVNVQHAVVGDIGQRR